METFWQDPFVLLQLVLFFGLLGCSAFFSGTEVAIFSLNPIQLEQMEKEGNPRLALLRKLLSDPRNLIATILIGNELVNVAASNISATLLIKLLGGEEKWWVNVVVMLPILLLLGEITPKTLAVRHNKAAATLVSRPISLFMRLISPLRLVVKAVADYLITLMIGKAEAKTHVVTEDMVRTLAGEAAEEGVLDDAERTYIDNIFNFGNLRVRDVMTPRARIAFLPKGSSGAEALRTFRQAKVTRIPVYEGHRDDILGVLHLRDLLKSGPGFARQSEELCKLLRKPYFVTGNRKVSSLFHTFRERKLSIAMVVDEFGGLIGLVTMEDLLETIFGPMGTHRKSETPPPRPHRGRLLSGGRGDAGGGFQPHAGRSPDGRHPRRNGGRGGAAPPGGTAGTGGASRCRGMALHRVEGGQQSHHPAVGLPRAGGKHSLRRWGRRGSPGRNGGSDAHHVGGRPPGSRARLHPPTPPRRRGGKRP
ncbi:MAG: HlyC/CorC family transporter [Magnetococcales bacterium]|nr:HlyC/CorC family transporter [Magnetococcales bacterium]